MADKEAEETIIVTETGEDKSKVVDTEDKSKLAPKPGDKKPENEEAGEDETVVSIDGVTPAPEEEQDAENAPDWVKDVRKRNKELTKQNRELQEQLKKTPVVEKAIEIGEKPTLEGCGYDGDKFETELISWQDRKRQADAKAQETAKEREAVEANYKKRQSDYETAKSNLKVKNFSDAEEVVKSTLSQMQQAILIKGANDSALVVYALGSNPDKAKELAAIKDPIDFAFAVARLEGKVKVSTRKAPPPEKVTRSSGGASNLGGNTDAKLERLRAEAAKTGNYTEVTKYKRELKQAGK